MTAIIRWRPGRTLAALEPLYRPLSPIDEVEELAREVWGSWRPVALHTSLTPHMDMYEEKGELVMKAELTGVKKEDLDISLEGDVLTIKAEKNQEEVAEEATHYTGERYFGHYSRSQRLPFHVDAEKASATFENGVLEIRLTKTEEAKARQIEVKALIPQGGEKKRQRRRKKTAS
ncbi:Hsp20/alpha crystallin family protein [Chloroflexota bacterium]